MPVPLLQKGVISGHLAQQINHGGAGCNVEHQVGNALAVVCIAETLKPVTKIFQLNSLLKMVLYILTGIREKVYNGLVKNWPGFCRKMS